MYGPYFKSACHRLFLPILTKRLLPDFASLSARRSLPESPLARRCRSSVDRATSCPCVPSQSRIRPALRRGSSLRHSSARASASGDMALHVPLSLRGFFTSPSKPPLRYAATHLLNVRSEISSRSRILRRRSVASEDDNPSSSNGATRANLRSPSSLSPSSSISFIPATSFLSVFSPRPGARNGVYRRKDCHPRQSRWRDSRNIARARADSPGRYVPSVSDARRRRFNGDSGDADRETFEPNTASARSSKRAQRAGRTV